MVNTVGEAAQNMAWGSLERFSPLAACDRHFPRTFGARLGQF